MIIAILIGSGLYGLIAVLFLIFSAAELSESGRSTPARLLLTVVLSGLWPMTLLVMSLTVALTRRENAGSKLRKPAPARLFQRSH